MLIAGASVLANGADALRPYRLSIPGMFGLYFLAGVVGGIVFGILKPLGRTQRGSALLGVLVGLPVSFLIVAVAAPDFTIGGGDFIAVWLMMASLGPFCAVGIWNFVNRR